MTSHPEDRGLVDRLLAGDEAAFSQFFDRYAPGLFRFALIRLNGDGDAAEEVVQATFAQAIRKLSTYRAEAALFTWLCTFCRHELSAHYQRAHRRVPQLPLLEDMPEVKAALESLASGVDGPDEQLAKHQTAALVRITLDALPPHYANALEWKYLHDLPLREIATRLGVTTKAAESLLTRARDAFRDAFVTLNTGAQGRPA
jgi:RNA polymerase sigma-70 factor (ECF subfamily)